MVVIIHELYAHVFADSQRNETNTVAPRLLLTNQGFLQFFTILM